MPCSESCMSEMGQWSDNSAPFHAEMLRTLLVQAALKKPRARKPRREGADPLREPSSDSITTSTTRRSRNDPTAAGTFKLPDLSATDRETGFSHRLRDARYMPSVQPFKMAGVHDNTLERSFHLPCACGCVLLIITAVRVKA
jgi:hypothetical protein